MNIIKTTRKKDIRLILAEILSPPPYLHKLYGGLTPSGEVKKTLQGCMKGGVVGGEFMAVKKVLSKDSKVKKEIDKLKKIFKDLDKNKLNAVISLIENAAFMTVTLEELQETININGCISQYQNGKNQFGTKKSPEVEIYIAMTKNYSAIIKQLTELIPPEKRKSSKLQALRNE